MPILDLKDTRVSYVPTPEEVDALISRAQQHPLGLEYLLHGAFDSVAATFAVHAFTVDAVRARLLKA